MGHPAMVFAQPMRDLAPTICRQRLVIEGTCDTPLSDADIRGYLVGRSDVYTCKVFETERAVDFTHRFLRAGQIVAKAF